MIDLWIFTGLAVAVELFLIAALVGTLRNQTLARAAKESAFIAFGFWFMIVFAIWGLTTQWVVR